MTMMPGYQADEALEMMRLATVVDAAISPTTKVGEPIIPPDAEAHMLNPVSRPLMPADWKPMPSLDGTWHGSICDSILLNRAMLVRRSIGGTTQYCLAFRGTSNLPNVIEDGASQYTVPAGPTALQGYDLESKLDLADGEAGNDLPGLAVPVINSSWTYVSGGLQTDARAHVALGFRTALESLDYAKNIPDTIRDLAKTLELLISRKVLPEPKQKLVQQILEATASQALSEMLGKIEEDEPEIYVTGHSLGAAMAQLAAAWLVAGGLPGKKPKVKLYAFAAPKPGEEYFCNSARYALGADMAYCVDNALDSVPQVGLSVEVPADLVSDGVLKILQLPDRVIQALDALKLPSPMNLQHVGSIVPLNGQLPITMGPTDVIPAIYLSDPSQTMTLQEWADDKPEIATLLGEVWQHMPWVYLALVAGKSPI